MVLSSINNAVRKAVSTESTSPTKPIVDLRVDPLMGQDTVPVGAGETDRVASAGLEQCDDILVDRSCVDHRDDLQCFHVGNPSPVDQLLSDTQSFGDPGSQLSAAMHKNFFSRDGRKTIQKMHKLRLIIDDVPADLYD